MRPCGCEMFGQAESGLMYALKFIEAKIVAPNGLEIDFKMPTNIGKLLRNRGYNYVQLQPLRLANNEKL